MFFYSPVVNLILNCLDFIQVDMKQKTILKDEGKKENSKAHKNVRPTEGVGIKTNE